VVDELHKFKNEDAIMSKNLRVLRDSHNSVVVGLTGTVMQNRHKELWNALDMVAKDFFGDWKTFDFEYARPIALSRYVMPMEYISACEMLTVHVVGLTHSRLIAQIFRSRSRCCRDGRGKVYGIVEEDG